MPAHERNIRSKAAIYHSIRVLSIWWFCFVGIWYMWRPLATDLLVCDICKSLFSITTISTQILSNIPKARGNLNSRKLFVNDTFRIFFFFSHLIFYPLFIQIQKDYLSEKYFSLQLLKSHFIVFLEGRKHNSFLEIQLTDEMN